MCALQGDVYVQCTERCGLTFVVSGYQALVNVAVEAFRSRNECVSANGCLPADGLHWSLQWASGQASVVSGSTAERLAAHRERMAAQCVWGSMSCPCVRFTVSATVQW